MLVSPLRADGHPHFGTADRKGVAMQTVRRKQAMRYPELGRSGWWS
jgi:hypothetical protein